MTSSDRINLERLHEAANEALLEAYAVALELAHDAPKELMGDPPVINSHGAFGTWAARSKAAFRLGDEIARRHRGKLFPWMGKAE